MKPRPEPSELLAAAVAKADKPKPVRLLALDPSSSCTGYAFFVGSDTNLVEHGTLKPEKADDPANVRIWQMLMELHDMVIELKPDVILVEDTSGKVSARHKGSGAGLAVYGKAVGGVLFTLMRTGRNVIPILENTWTRDMSKDARQAAVAAQFKAYVPADDRGQDKSDAIFLGQWWMQEEAIKARTTT